MSEERRIENIPIYKIIPNIYQPRIKFDDKSINDLANSIKAHGIIQPLIVRKLGGTYEIIDGERRYKAAKKIGIQEVPSIVLDVDEKEAAELILMENMQKQLLTPIEEANAYQQIMLLNKFDTNELSNKLGRDKNVIESKLKLLTLSSEIQEALLNNKIAEGHARALTKINDKEKQLELFRRVLKERLPVKVLEEILSKEADLLIEHQNEEQKEKDTISLNDLNKIDFFKTNEENKMEEQKMDNNQLNFNQYNNLLKEKEKPEMVNSAQPEPILGNVISEPKPNDFFPSLEEQPLNMEVPVMTQSDIVEPVQMPQFEVSTPSMAISEQTMVAQQPVPPVMEVPQMPEMQAPMQMPQFEVPTPSMTMSEQTMATQQPVPPVMEVPQMLETQAPMQMPQFEVPTPSMAMTEQTMATQQPVPPVMEVPQMPEMQGPMQVPQFEVPTANMAMTEPSVQPTTNTQPVITDVMPAVNMIRNLIPLLENSGYKINIEETDNLSEYQIVLKVEK